MSLPGPLKGVVNHVIYATFNNLGLEALVTLAVEKSSWNRLLYVDIGVRAGATEHYRSEERRKGVPEFHGECRTVCADKDSGRDDFDEYENKNGPVYKGSMSTPACTVWCWVGTVA